MPVYKNRSVLTAEEALIEVESDDVENIVTIPLENQGEVTDEEDENANDVAGEKYSNIIRLHKNECPFRNL